MRRFFLYTDFPNHPDSVPSPPLSGETFHPMFDPQSFSLKNRVALVTGSSTGLGKAMAAGLGRAGARVAVNYQNNKERAEKSFAEMQQAGVEGMLVRGDVSNPEDVTRMVDEIAQSLGPVDIIVLNATPAQPQKPFEEYDWDFFQQMLDFFVKSPFLLTRACLPHMKSQRWGRIINIGSEVVARAVSPFTGYVAAKGAQNGFHRSLASELAPWNITVNMISPGWIPVERHENDPEDLKEGYRKLIPMARWGIPDDVAGAAVFLASEAAGFITGQNLHINGGMTTQ
jgi:3-oxoacyl-[acyl-carrier protein] reductase